MKDNSSRVAGDHAFDNNWASPSAIYRSAPFWGWNAKLDPARLRRQIEAMAQGGMGGFFMHSRYGLKTPYFSREWFDCVRTCVEKAGELGMKAYLYDEDRWASGTAAGAVTRKHPGYRQQYLVPVEGDLPDPAERRTTLRKFIVKISGGRLVSYRPDRDGDAPGRSELRVRFELCRAKESAWFNDAAYVDVMQREAVAEFIRLGYEPYARRLGQEFGKRVPAIFCDEFQLHCGYYPWTGRLPAEFRARRGYDLLSRLPELAYVHSSGFSKTRHDYFRTVSELFVENFTAQIGAWCARHKIALTGHCQGEPHLESQTRCAAASMPHYEHMQWPGMDVLRDRDNELSSCKQISSVAAQLGKKRVMSEMYGCTGWDWPLEGHKFNAGWQFALGVNFRCVHLSWYSMAGGGKRDCPASVFPHSPWWKYYRVVEDYFGRLSFILTQGRPVRDVLMLHPVESAWGVWVSQGVEPGSQVLRMGKGVEALNTHYEGLVRALVEQHYDYDLGDEGIMSRHAHVAHGDDGARLRVGLMEYRLVLVPPCHTLRRTTVGLLKKFVQAGGKVLFAGIKPNRVDGELSEDAESLVASGHHCPTDAADRVHGMDSCVEEIPPYRAATVIAAMEELLPRRLSITADGVQCAPLWSMLRQVSGGQILYVQSVDRQGSRKARVSVCGSLPVVEWNAGTGARRLVEAEQDGENVTFELSLPQRGAALFTLGMKVAGAAPVQKAFKASATVPARGPWKISLSEPNSLSLDYCRYRVGKGRYSASVPVLLADAKLRNHFGLPARDNQGSQPWYLAQTGRWDETGRGVCELQFEFTVDVVPGRIHLAVENPAAYRFFLNGNEVPNRPDGWWVDEDIHLLPLTGFVRAGQNELRLFFDFRSDLEIEELHLVGDFGVRQAGAEPVPGAYALTAPPSRLEPGSWGRQGLPFYGSGVRYHVPVPESVRRAAAAGKQVRISLPGAKGSCFAVHAAGRTTVLAWAPYEAEIGREIADLDGVAEIEIEVIGGRRNSFGPLHVPWTPWMGWEEGEAFNPHNPQWRREYQLNDHGLITPPVFEVSDQKQ